jgi:D-alanyl-D-alanine carboxypeptidase
MTWCRFRPTSVIRVCAVALLSLGLVTGAMTSADAKRRSTVKKYAAVVIDAVSGEVLHAVNADKRNYPASLTKMMTLYLVFEALDSGQLALDQPLKVSRRAARQPPSRLGVGRGKTIAVDDAILALVTKSANDVAAVIAESLGGSEREFAKIMTRKARSLGMSRTTFRNASGLPHSKQLTTARDLAQLARALLTDFPHYYHYFGTRAFTYAGRTHRNHNKLLKSFPGTDGIKTGYIHASGFNLAASVERDGRRLIGVIMGGRSARSRDRQMAKLLSQSFASLPNIDPAVSPEIVKVAKKSSTRNGKKVNGHKKPNPVAAESWSIEVGAFDSFARAHLAVTRTATTLPRVLMRAKISIERENTDGDASFRARLTGMTEAKARRACRLLAEKDMPCSTIQSAPDLEVAEKS